VTGEKLGMPLRQPRQLDLLRQCPQAAGQRIQRRIDSLQVEEVQLGGRVGFQRVLLVVMSARTPSGSTDLCTVSRQTC
jgi:hypothetical protein